MAASLNINSILSQVKQLDKEEQFIILEKLASFLKKAEATNTGSIHLVSLSGLGRDVWKNEEDIDNYIEEERKW